MARWLRTEALYSKGILSVSIVMLSISCTVDSMINCSSTTSVSSPDPSQVHAVGSGTRLVQSFDREGLCQVQVSLWSVTSKTATVLLLLCSYMLWLPVVWHVSTSPALSLLTWLMYVWWRRAAAYTAGVMCVDVVWVWVFPCGVHCYSELVVH